MDGIYITESLYHSYYRCVFLVGLMMIIVVLQFGKENGGSGGGVVVGGNNGGEVSALLACKSRSLKVLIIN